jgi:beta-1,4-mannosyl-glycoprotein beta-1,4-N-acetylglucosaminyltransferase
MKIIDSFIFYNELELLKYRLAILNDYVDYFVLAEATYTFSGIKKPLFYNENKEMFKEYEHKIIHVIVDDVPIKEEVHDDRSWLNEYFHRNAIARGIHQLSLTAEDCIFTSDLDEICDPEIMKKLREGTLEYDKYALNRLELDMYYYNLNCRVSGGWHGLKLFTFASYMLNQLTFQDMRTWEWKHPVRIIPKGGWHLSYFGNADYIVNKIKHFAHQEFNKDRYTNKEIIEKVVDACEDILFRDGFKLTKVPIAENTYLPPKYDIYLKNFIRF